MNGAEAVARVLTAAGVDRAFGVTGESVLALVDALDREGVAYTQVRHEGAGAGAADGYARHHRRPAACLGHVGAGATNLVNGVANAWKDSVPMAVLLGNAETDHLGRDVWHEVDQLGILEPVAKWTGRLGSPAAVPQRLREAARALSTGPPGPVVLDVPADVATAAVDDDAVEAVASSTRTFLPDCARVPPSDEAVVAAAEGFLAADVPAVLVGGGAATSRAGDVLRELVAATGVPVVSTLSGRGVLPESHDCSFGPMGVFGRESAALVADRTDFLLALGTELSDTETFEWTAYPDADVVQVNLDPAELGRQYDVHLPVQADVRAFLEALVDELDARAGDDLGDPPPALSAAREAREETTDAVTDPAPADRADTDAGLVNPHAVLAVLADVVGPDDVVTSGAGQHAVWATLLPVDRPGQFLKSAGLGTMGYGLPAGLGAATEADGTAFVLVGDGDLAMSCGELWSCVQAGVDVVVVVFDDAQLSAIKTTQQDRYDRTVGVDHVPADLAAVAEGFGAHGVRVETGDAVEAAVEAAVAVDGPALVDVAVDPDVEAPSFFYESR